MVERHRGPARRPVWGGASVAVVLVLAGVLFAANAKIAGGASARQTADLPQLVQEEIARAEEIAAEVRELRAEVDGLTDALATGVPSRDPEHAELIELASGRLPVTGEGLTVRLTDAPGDRAQPDWVTNNDLVVHQQDLQAVINALWAGGAEAMTLQGQRVVSTSAFRCVGNVLFLHGRTYSPPYVVRAIGDQEDLRAALEASPAVRTYLQYVDAVGLGWSVSEEGDLELAGYEGSNELRYAKVPEGIDVFGTRDRSAPAAQAAHTAPGARDDADRLASRARSSGGAA